MLQTTDRGSRWLLAATVSTLLAPAVARSENPPPANADELEPVIVVIGKRSNLDTIPGSGMVLDQSVLEESHVFSVNEAMRKVPGIFARDEEGFGLRPNLGIRGLNPTRSAKLLMLEDGILLAYAPYGDNASYYHPPIDRFDRIEVLKGASVNMYGPQTIGGVINYLTPTPPADFEGLVRMTAGNRDYSNAHALVGGGGFQLDLIDKRGDGARENIDSELQDYNTKYVTDIAANQTLIVRANRYEEDSNLTYSGLTDAELANFGHRYNPFDNDTFESERTGLSLTHDWRLAEGLALTTNVYWSEFSRDWWRQASTTSDSQCNAVVYDVNGQLLNFTQARAAGHRVDPDDCDSRQGRLRDYDSYGVEPRLTVAHRLFGIDSELMIGARAHSESQQRKQVNGNAPTAVTGAVVEDNERQTDAYAAFLQNRMTFGRLEVTPGLRMENVTNDRDNALTDATGDADLTEWLPSLGLSYPLAERVTLFGGVHKGFAPPRTEDLIDNAGVVTDVNPEESLNVELGLRDRKSVV